MYNILISGYYGFDNIGDESILRTLVSSLREHIPGCSLTVLSHNPASTREKYGVEAVERMSPMAILRAVKQCDMLISGGGSLLQDVTSSKSLHYYLSIIRCAEFFHKKVFIYSQGIGPIDRPGNRRAAAAALAELGLARYEISNYAVPGAECRHNLAVWRGEDYVGLGAGACGRIGLLRTRNFGVERELEVKGGDAARVGGERWRWRGDELEVKGGGGEWKLTLPRSTSDSHLHLKKEEHPRSTSDSHLQLKEKCEVETLSPERDALERRIFRLRTREGLDATGYPQWGQALASACESGLLTRENEIYRLTSRGTEVCDAILAELV